MIEVCVNLLTKRMIFFEDSNIEMQGILYENTKTRPFTLDLRI